MIQKLQVITVITYYQLSLIIYYVCPAKIKSSIYEAIHTVKIFISDAINDTITKNYFWAV